MDPRNASGSCELGPAGREWILRVRNRGTRVDPQNLHRRVGPVTGGAAQCGNAAARSPLAVRPSMATGALGMNR